MRDVSIHAPREGCDIDESIIAEGDEEFQFTHPGRGATSKRLPAIIRRSLFQFTHPGRGATDKLILQISIDSSFNSRTPGGVRQAAGENSELGVQFQFTHPGRGATVQRSY